jgi:hypothetical protein
MADTNISSYPTLITLVEPFGRVHFLFAINLDPY